MVQNNTLKGIPENMFCPVLRSMIVFIFLVFTLLYLISLFKKGIRVLFLYNYNETDYILFSMLQIYCNTVWLFFCPFALKMVPPSPVSFSSTYTDLAEVFSANSMDWQMKKYVHIVSVKYLQKYRVVFYASSEWKYASKSSEPAELKRYRLKRKASRNVLCKSRGYTIIQFSKDDL